MYHCHPEYLLKFLVLKNVSFSIFNIFTPAFREVYFECSPIRTLWNISRFEPRTAAWQLLSLQVSPVTSSSELYITLQSFIYFSFKNLYVDKHNDIFVWKYYDLQGNWIYFLKSSLSKIITYKVPNYYYLTGGGISEGVRDVS